ncbi:MAG: C40 family peptidase [Rhizobiales bacterium]|nr:C40 family peptidase [Hyphomicrobiales bacterium]MBI3672104.1 C40 family peptidase [Hyphomicrobiales bacterium]
MNALDQRLNAWRPDLADARLKGSVEAERFVEGLVMQVREAVVPVRRAPHVEARQLTQALLGERLKVFEEREGWSFVQLLADGYVGYVAATAIAPDPVPPTHRIAVPLTYLYPAADLKSQPALAVTLNAEVTVQSVEGSYARLADGRFAFAPHLRALSEFETDFVVVAERFLHVPYYWGGKSALGLDCSGLVQLALNACGMACPRDSDMQERDLGRAVAFAGPGGLRRGDLIFWKGHVGIMADGASLLHANGHHLMVVREPVAEAIARIAASGSIITSVRRLQ